MRACGLGLTAVMRFIIVASLFALSVTGCVARSNEERSYRYDSAETVADSPPDSWDGEPIQVEEAHGDIEVAGIPGKRNVTVRARFTSVAENGYDARLAFADLAMGLRVAEEDGRWVVRCPHQAFDHATAKRDASECKTIVVEVFERAARRS